MTKRTLLLAAMLFCMLALLSGCDDEDNGVVVTAEQLTNEGWNKFEAGDYGGAASSFEAAVALDTSYHPAYLGLGWAHLKQRNAGLAEEALKTYSLKVSGSDDAIAGLALACHAQDKLKDAIDYATQLLSSDPTWSFSHDVSSNYLDVALVLAHSYYETGDFQSSLDVVNQYFDPGFSVDPNTDQGRADLAVKLDSLYTG